MKDILKMIGGIIVIIAILTVLPCVWADDNVFWWKILATEIVVIALIFVFDVATDKDED